MSNVLPPHVLECAVRKNALRFIEDGNDIALALRGEANGESASEKKHSFITHLFKSTLFEIAVMPWQLALGVLMERSAFVARQKSTQELERLKDSPHDAIQTLQFQDPSTS